MGTSLLLFRVCSLLGLSAAAISISWLFSFKLSPCIMQKLAGFKCTKRNPAETGQRGWDGPSSDAVAGKILMQTFLGNLCWEEEAASMCKARLDVHPAVMWCLPLL